MPQCTLENEPVLDLKVRETLSIIERAANKSGVVPLIVNYSGGKDSAVLLDLVKKVTKNFLCFYAVSGIEFPESIDFAIESSRRAGAKLLISYPSDYKGGFFDRLAKFKEFPTIKKTWCSRDLKFRAQRRKLEKLCGKKAVFYKLNGVRRFESTRRRRMHVATPKKGFIIADYNVSHDFMVFPILNWRNEDVLNYLKREKLRIPQNPLYDKYTVSGCYYCPFYQPSIYRQILKHNPNLYDEFIEWEIKLNQPSVSGFHWLRDIKKSVLEKRPVEDVNRLQ